MTAQTPALPMPKHRREANTLMSSVGRIERRRKSLKRRFDARRKPHQEAIARLNREFELLDSALEAEQKLSLARLFMFTSRWWDKLPKPPRGERTVTLATGSLQRKANLSALTIADGKKAYDVIQWLLRNKHLDLLDQIVRIDVSELKKPENTAILDDLKAAGLVAQKSGDTVYVKPDNWGKTIRIEEPDVLEIIQNGLPQPVAVAG